MGRWDEKAKKNAVQSGRGPGEFGPDYSDRKKTMSLDALPTRDLQKEAARVIATMEATSVNIYKFNRSAHHNSHNWYKTVIQWYIDQHGDLPSKTGPGKDVKLILK